MRRPLIIVVSTLAGAGLGLGAGYAMSRLRKPLRRWTSVVLNPRNPRRVA